MAERVGAARDVVGERGGFPAQVDDLARQARRRQLVARRRLRAHPPDLDAAAAAAASDVAFVRRGEVLVGR